MSETSLEQDDELNHLCLRNDKGSEAGSIRFSYTNNATEGIIENSDLDSHNFNLRAVANLSDKLTIDAKATYFIQRGD